MKSLWGVKLTKSKWQKEEEEVMCPPRNHRIPSPPHFQSSLTLICVCILYIFDQGCIFFCLQKYELLRGLGKNDYKPKQKKRKGKEKGEKGKGKKRKEIGKKNKKVVFGSHRKISKTFWGKKLSFSPGWKNIIYFRDVNVFKIWSKIL